MTATTEEIIAGVGPLSAADSEKRAAFARGITPIVRNLTDQTNTAAETVKKAMAEIAAKAVTRTKEEIRQWEFENEVTPHLVASQCPLPFFAPISDWNSKQGEVLAKCRAALNASGAIVALVGPRGLGKTTIAAQLILERAWNNTLTPCHRRPPYRKSPWMVQQFKALYSDFGSRDNEKLMAQMDSYAKDHPLFIIDEWNESDEMRAHDRLMTDFLDRRYSWNNDTLIISNQTAEKFNSSTNNSTLSRMQESGGIINCDWPSFR